MKTIIIAILALIVGFGAAWMLLPDAGQSATNDEQHAAEKQQYTCGMHPQIISDEPGYCPICGMKLTPKKNGVAAAEGAVMIDPATTQNMGLVTTPAVYRPMSRLVRAFGKIGYSEPDNGTINVKVAGWAERLYVDREGEQVHAGQPLLELYSPDLVAAQREFLIAQSAGGGLVEAARLRLRNWDISDDQIDRLLATGEVKRTMTVRAPSDGVVVAKHVAEGDYLKPGMELYRTADLSTVWVIAHVYEQDLPFVKVGQEAMVELPNLPGEHFAANVSYVSPYLDAKRLIEIRLEADNDDARLKPEMYAEVTIRSGLEGDRLVIPAKAIINSGTRKLVYVSSGDGAYQPRIVTTGASGAGDMVEVRQGLTPEDQVVVSGQFLLDSESRLSETLNMGGHQHGDMVMASAGTKDAEPAEKHDHASHEKKIAADSLSGIYTCPMPQHFDVVQYGGGDCSKCGMKLVPLENTENDNVYVCPMRECGVAQSGPGNCPVCGMPLIKHQGEAGHDR